MSASVLDQIRWSETDYDMKEFVELFGDSLPLLCQTTSGYSGCDEDIHQVAADEIYWIYGIHRQTRIVAKDKSKRYISIPVESCSFKFQVIEDDNKKERSLVTSADLLTSFQKSSSARIRFQFEKNQTVSYQIGADTGNATRFGIMELKESYEEKYLLGFGMHSGYLYARTCGIPVYMDVSLTRAMGFEAKMDEGEAAFRRWLGEMRKLVDSIQKTSINTCQGVIVFPERPSNGNYEYIRPTNFVIDTSKKPDKTETQSDTKTENEYAYITTIRPGLEATTKTCNIETSPSSTGRAPEGRRSRLEEIIRVPLPQIPRRPPPVPSELAEDRTILERAPAPLPAAVDDDLPPAIPSRKPQSKSKSGNRKGSKSENDPVYQGGDYCNNLPSPPPLPSSHQYLSYEMTIPGTERGQTYTSLADLHSNDPSEMDPSESPSNDLSDVDSSGVEATSGSRSRHGDRIEHSKTGMSNRAPPPIPPLPQKWTNPIAKMTETAATNDATDIGSRMARYVTASEVPLDEDAENWTISDVTEALRLLKMSKYANLFSEREIDGALLCSLDEATLVEDFGFKQFEATKFFMFVRKGWRPK